MKRLLLLALLGCAIGGVALAQNPPTANINTSLQGSQFGNGPVGIDTSSNLYAPSHLNFLGNKQSGTTSPTLCGAATITSASTDNVFQVTVGAAATSCQILFGTVFVNIPACILTVPGSSVLPTFSATTTGVNLQTFPAGGAKVAGICLGND